MKVRINMAKFKVHQWMGVALLSGACWLTLSTPAFAQSAQPATAAAEQAGAEPGVLIVAVEPGSPAATADIRRGDILLTANDQPVDSVEALAATLEALAPGDTLTLTVQHGDETRTVDVTLADRDGWAFLGVQPYAALEQANVVVERWAPPMAGHRIFPAPGMPSWMEETLTLSDTVGIHIMEVISGSPAAEAGLQPGDLVVAVDGEPITPETDLAALVAQYRPGDELALTVQSFATPPDTGEREVTVTLGAKPEDAETAYLGVRVAPMIFMRAQRLHLPPDEQMGDVQQFRRRQQGDRFFFHQPMPPVPPMPPMPPMLVVPYGYWYGAPGYGMMPHPMPPPMDFLWMHPAPGAGPEIRRFELAPGDQARPVPPPMLNHEENEIL
jgi:membrane-associated protease RseP (regulator of RpoE activity)